MTTLQLTETLSSVTESAAQEPRPFILLFMLLVIISLAIALVMLYNDGRKREALQIEAYKLVANDLKIAVSQMTHAIDVLSNEQRSTHLRVDSLSDYIRENIK